MDDKTIITAILAIIFGLYLAYVGLSFGEALVAALISGAAIWNAER